MSSTTVVVGDQLPQATINTPLPRAAYAAGQTVPFSGSGFDPESDPVGLQWTILLHHCHLQAAGCHTHPFLGLASAGGTLIAPDEEGEIMYLELRLTATDSAGLSTTTSINIGPDTDGDGLLDYEEQLSYGTDFHDPDTDDDGCADGREAGSDPVQGGQRDPLNSWDYFNPTQDGTNRSDDVSAIVTHYGHDSGDPLYATRYDRSPLPGGHPWQFGPPDGLIRAFEISAAVTSYAHDCAP
jgi:hypothetical protein